MDFLLKAPGQPRRVGILPGSFHPITRAHVALARAALEVVDEVILVMPRRFPHKDYEQVTLEQRIELVCRAAAAEPNLSVAITEGGLFLEIAREARQAYPQASFFFLCGRDAAERIVGWNYQGECPIEEQLTEFSLLVADRQGHYEAPLHLQDRVMHLQLDAVCDAISATEVRRRIAEGQDWRGLVPETIADDVKLLYGGGT